jgi:hypothetical protein
MFPVETIVWKHSSEMIICPDINVDNLETPGLEKG